MSSSKGNTFIMIGQGQQYICNFDIDLDPCCFCLGLFYLVFNQWCGFTEARTLKMMIWEENIKVQLFLLLIGSFFHVLGCKTVKNAIFLLFPVLWFLGQIHLFFIMFIKKSAYFVIDFSLSPTNFSMCGSGLSWRHSTIFLLLKYKPR